MALKLIIWAVVILCGLYFSSVVLAGEKAIEAGSSARLEGEVGFQISRLPDLRVQKLQSYMLSRNAPLAVYAEEFVVAADEYDLDWRLVAAISGVESNFGKHIPYGSYNAWGWANGKYRFRSWQAAIYHVNKVVKEKYYDRGLVTPELMAPVYAPPSKTWSGNVRYFLNELDRSPVPAIGQLAMKI